MTLSAAGEPTAPAPGIEDPVRLDAVRATGLLDSAAIASFDQLTALAARLLDAPMAFLMLVDERRSFWLSCAGVDATTPQERQNAIDESFCQYVIADAQPVIIEDAAGHPRTKDNPAVAGMGVRAWAGFPVVDASGQPLGSFCAVDVIPRQWTPEQVELLAVLAQAASSQLALLSAVEQERAARDNVARLSAAEQDAERRLAGLSAVALELAGARTVDDLARVVFEHGLVALGADGGAVSVRDDDAGLVRLAVSDSLGEHVQIAYGELPLDSPLPAAYVARTGETVLFPTKAAGLQWSPLTEAVYEATGRYAWATLPLRTADRLLGALVVSWIAERQFTAVELGLLDAFAAQCAQALDRIVTAEAQQVAAAAVQRFSEALQRVLLTRPPAPADVTIAVRYQPANEAAQVGGDWFDAFVTAAGTTTVVIGDVNGHDRDAAAAMAQVRNIVRGLAYDSTGPPANLLWRLDRALQGLEVDTLATALVGQVEHSGGDVPRLRWSSAGHPPPLLRLADGSVHALTDGADVMLGVDPQLPRQDHVVDLPAGSTILLYTDGLIERRGASIDDGLSWLSDALSQLGDQDLDALCDGLLDAVADGAAEDDIALLVLRPRDAADGGDDTAGVRR